MSAAAEVSDALTVYEKNAEKIGYVDKQVEALAQAVEINQELLAWGGSTTTYLEVLTAQQSLLAAQTAQIECRRASAQAVISLYQSLGGGR